MPYALKVRVDEFLSYRRSERIEQRPVEPLPRTLNPEFT